MTKIPDSDINELFARDPLTHTDEEIEKMCAYFRSARGSFNQGAKQAGAAKKSSAAKKKPVIEVDLGDLFD